MPHFPSTFHTGGYNAGTRGSDLNATQKKPASHQIFSTVEEELHDARRVHAHGQEEDLRLALNMVINRVSELSSLLSDAYKARADLEVQLNVAKSNLQLVISNNEMLEEALKRDPSGHARDVGWRRSSARETDSRRASEERQSSLPTPTIAPAPASAFGVTHGLDSAGGRNSPAVPPTPATAEERRFFKFRFTTGSSSAGARPATPNGTAIATGLYHHLNSPSLPSLPAHAKELEELNEQLQKERAAKKKVGDEKAALEAELESLSQALFEEANKMVATERIKRAETEDELKEARLEKEALRSALRLLEDQHSSETSSPMMPFTSSPSPSSSSAPAASAPILSMSAPMSHSRTSSEIAIKSAPISPSSSRPLTRSPSPAPSPSTLPSPLPSSTSQTHSPPTIPDITPQRLRPPPLPLDEPVSARGKYDREHEHELEVDVQLEDEVTPQIRRSRPPSLHLHDYNPAFELSPWADAPSQSQAHAHSRRTPGMGIFSGATV